MEGVLQPVTGIQPKEAETVHSKTPEIYTVQNLVPLTLIVLQYKAACDALYY